MTMTEQKKRPTTRAERAARATGKTGAPYGARNGKARSGWDLRTLPKCNECGGRIRKPRTDQKRCGRCKETKAVTEFGHARSRADHLEGYCLECRRWMSREKNSRTRNTGKTNRIFGNPRPISAEEVPVANGWLIGRFFTQRRYTDRVVVPSRKGIHNVEFRAGGDPVYEIRLTEVFDSVHETYADAVVTFTHACAEVAGTLFQEGEWLVAVFDADRWLVKLIRTQDPEFADAEELPGVSLPCEEALGTRSVTVEGVTFDAPRDWVGKRPWAMRLVLEDLDKAVDGTGCPICDSPEATLDEFTLVCPTCTDAKEYAAEDVMLRYGGLPIDLAIPYIIALETKYLLERIPDPKEMESVS